MKKKWYQPKTIEQTRTSPNDFARLVDLFKRKHPQHENKTPFFLWRERMTDADKDRRKLEQK